VISRRCGRGPGPNRGPAESRLLLWPGSEQGWPAPLKPKARSGLPRRRVLSGATGCSMCLPMNPDRLEGRQDQPPAPATATFKVRQATAVAAPLVDEPALVRPRRSCTSPNVASCCWRPPTPPTSSNRSHAFPESIVAPPCHQCHFHLLPPAAAPCQPPFARRLPSGPIRSFRAGAVISGDDNRQTDPQSFGSFPQVPQLRGPGGTALLPTPVEAPGPSRDRLSARGCRSFL